MDPEDSAGESDIENEDPDEDAVAKQLQFVKLLKRFPVLLEKSQVPAIKNAKKRAATEMLALLADTQALSLSQQQLMKKINNMKGKIREKTDPEKTGNKKISLNEWEKELYALINPKNSNPVFCQIPGAKAVGARIRRPPDVLASQDKDGAIASSSTASISRGDVGGGAEAIPPRPPASKKKKSAQEMVPFEVFIIAHSAEFLQILLSCTDPGQQAFTLVNCSLALQVACTLMLGYRFLFMYSSPFSRGFVIRT